nr:septum site-determining protein Ssd [Motilibacter aurantiacus]
MAVTADARLADDLVRLCAAAGIGCDVVSDAVDDLRRARGAWGAAALALVGADLAREVAVTLPRREGAVLVAHSSGAGEDAALWRSAVEAGCEHVAVLPEAEPWLMERLADAAEGRPGGGVVVSVLGGRGGAGATTLAAALAVTGARQGIATLLVDADPLGGGIDLILGSEDAGGLRWPQLQGAAGRVPAGALRDALPRIEGLGVLSWDRGDLLAVPSAAMSAVLAAARRSSDLVVVDLPRRVDTAVECALAASDVTLLVVPAEVRATAAATRVAAAAGVVAADLRLVVRGPAPGGLPADVIAESLGLPLAGELRAEPGLAVALEHGEPPGRAGRGPLAQFCRRFVTEACSTRRAA